MSKLKVNFHFAIFVPLLFESNASPPPPTSTSSLENRVKKRLNRVKVPQIPILSHAWFSNICRSAKGSVDTRNEAILVWLMWKEWNTESALKWGFYYTIYRAPRNQNIRGFQPWIGSVSGQPWAEVSPPQTHTIWPLFGHPRAAGRMNLWGKMDLCLISFCFIVILQIRGKSPRTVARKTGFTQSWWTRDSWLENKNPPEKESYGDFQVRLAICLAEN